VVPLERDLGLNADWRIISADDRFFGVTKAIHNALQGEQRPLTPDEMAIYRDYSLRNAQLLEGDYDVVIAHDPQPLAMRHYRGRSNTSWIWRCHIDTSEPNQEVWAALEPFLQEYEAAVFTMDQFVPPRLPVERVAVIAPAIDPLSPKNIDMPAALCSRILNWVGLEVTEPFVVQASRFDPWKDPLGVIAAYRMVREHLPDLQLVLVGSMALDDPQGWDVYRQIMAAAETDPLVHVFTNLTGVGNVEVNCLQRQASVVIQKSIREGFGLVVSEALWKETPVVAGRAGGIPLQMPDGVGGYLVESVEETAERLVELLTNADRARHLGRLGREYVKEHFLLPRLLADEIKLIAEVVGDR
jgi:trehalose synthase